MVYMCISHSYFLVILFHKSNQIMLFTVCLGRGEACPLVHLKGKDGWDDSNPNRSSASHLESRFLKVLSYLDCDDPFSGRS